METKLCPDCGEAMYNWETYCKKCEQRLKASGSEKTLSQILQEQQTPGQTPKTDLPFSPDSTVAHETSLATHLKDTAFDFYGAANLFATVTKVLAFVMFLGGILVGYLGRTVDLDWNFTFMISSWIGGAPLVLIFHGFSRVFSALQAIWQEIKEGNDVCP
jgi:hypothetical protein